MKKHTKGNWIAHDGQIFPEETGKTLALIPYFDKENEEEVANAQLIATAPSLLKTLGEIIPAMTTAKSGKEVAWDIFIEKARTVIQNTIV